LWFYHSYIVKHTSKCNGAWYIYY